MPPRTTYQRDDVCRLRSEFVRQLLVVGNQVCDVNVAVILLHERILAELIPADISLDLVVHFNTSTHR